MSTWADEAMSMIQDDDRAMELVHRIMLERGFTGVVFTPADMTVEVEEEDGSWDIYDFYEADSRVTPAMVNALTWSRVWRRGIPEALAERGGEMMPTVRIHPDGSFAITDHAAVTTTEFDADGNVKGEEV